MDGTPRLDRRGVWLLGVKRGNPRIYPQKHCGAERGALSRGEGALRKVVLVGGEGANPALSLADEQP